MSVTLSPPSAAVAGAAPDLETKVRALAQAAQALLGAHDAGFQRAGAVATYYSLPALKARSRADRLAIMAAPNVDAAEVRERYAEVEHLDEGAYAEPLLSGEGVDVADRFRLWVYYGVRLDLDDLAAEAAHFRALTRSRSAGAPGLAHYLRTAGGFLYVPDDDYEATPEGGGPWELEARVERAEYAFLQVDEAAKDYRWQAAITLTLTGGPAV